MIVMLNSDSWKLRDRSFFEDLNFIPGNSKSLYGKSKYGLNFTIRVYKRKIETIQILLNL
jgi:hypothetical protein